MVKRLFFLIVSSSILLIFSNYRCYAQNKRVSGEIVEKVLQHYNSALAQVQKENGVSNEDFTAFVNFSRNKLHAESRKVYAELKKGATDSLSLGEYEKGIVVAFSQLYSDFQKIKAEYPSSVKEYSAGATPKVLQTFNCDSACTNPDFSSGDLSGWYAAYADNYSGENPTNGNAYQITAPVGQLCIPGQQLAAYDVDLITNPLIIFEPEGTADYQIAIMHGGYDPIVPTIPRVSPFGSSAYSARVGDSTNPYFGMAILQQTFKVTSSNQNFTYQYAVFIENPANHTYYTQPFFTAVVLDSVGDTIPNCGKYLVTAGYGTNSEGWGNVTIPDPANGGGQTVQVYYRNWTSVFVSLKQYIGHCVTIRFTTSDCGQGGHFGYAYVSTSCSQQSILSSSPVFCGQKTITLTGPHGGQAYKWTGPTNGIVGSDSGQVVTIDSAGTYKVVVTPVTGTACNDSLTVTVPKGTGVAPKPSFTADSVCSGQTTNFTNTSTPGPGAGVKFYWDFNGFGAYQDSLSVNPTWKYITGGTFKVKLHEVYNGCGSDTIIPVFVDSLILPNYSSTAVAACIGSNVTFANTSFGATKYWWNFGDPASGKLDTSTAVSPTHKFTTAGTFTIDLIEGQTRGCPNDTVKTPLTVYSLIAPSAPIISGVDSICAGSSQLLQVSNVPNNEFVEYDWYTPPSTDECPFCTGIYASPSITTTYTITVTDYSTGCPSDTTFTLKVNPIPVPVITTQPNDTICRTDSTLLKVSGGGTYAWTPNNVTGDSIWVKPTSTTTYTLQTLLRGCPASTTQQVVVIYPGGQGAVLSADSICPGASTTMTAQGGTNYKWLAPLSGTNPSVTVSPSVSTIYSVVVMSECTPNDTVKKTVHVVHHPPITYTGSSELCKGNPATLTAYGGTNYQWFNGFTTTDGSTLTVTLVSNRTYTLTVDSGNCPSDSVIPLKVNPLPVVNLTNSTSICKGDSITLKAGGGGTYQWYNGSSADTLKVGPVINTKYTVVVTNSYSCVDSASANITVVTPPPSPIISGIDSVCKGSSQLLQVTNVQSGQYTWSPSSSVNCPTCSSVSATPTTNTTYTISFTNFTCPSDTTFTLKVNPIPTPTITTKPIDTLCRGDSILLKAVGACSYSWSPGNSTTDSIWVKPTINATYTLQTVCRGCNGSATQQVYVLYPGGQGVILSVDSICPAASTVMTASGGTSFEWLPPLSSINAAVTINPASSETYSVVVMSMCTPNDTVSQTVHVVHHPPIKLNGTTTVCVGRTTTLSASNGTNYQWSNGSATTDASSITVSSNATYTLTVDSGNCPTDSVVTFRVKPLPVATVSPAGSICLGDSIILMATGGGTYKWSNNSTDSVIKVSPSANTTYTVVITNSYLCADSALTNVTVRTPSLNVCCDTTIKYGASVILTASNSSSYSWLPDSGLTCTNCPTPIASPTLTTTYTVSAIDTDGCPVKQNVTVKVDARCADFTVPNVFTPNNDGIDDDFVINVSNTTSYSIVIYDRWGKQVFSSTNPTEYWNGRTNNTENLVSDGTYYYIITAWCNSNNYDKKGFVQVIGEK